MSATPRCARAPSAPTGIATTRGTRRRHPGISASDKPPVEVLRRPRRARPATRGSPAAGASARACRSRVRQQQQLGARARARRSRPRRVAREGQREVALAVGRLARGAADDERVQLGGVRAATAPAPRAGSARTLRRSPRRPCGCRARRRRSSSRRHRRACAAARSGARSPSRGSNSPRRSSARPSEAHGCSSCVPSRRRARSVSIRSSPRIVRPAWREAHVA